MRHVRSARSVAISARSMSGETCSPCSAACRTASVMASACSDVSLAAVSARAMACVSNTDPYYYGLSPTRPNGCPRVRFPRSLAAGRVLPALPVVARLAPDQPVPPRCPRAGYRPPRRHRRSVRPSATARSATPNAHSAGVSIGSSPSSPSNPSPPPNPREPAQPNSTQSKNDLLPSREDTREHADDACLPVAGVGAVDLHLPVAIDVIAWHWRLHAVATALDRVRPSTLAAGASLVNRSDYAGATCGSRRLRSRSPALRAVAAGRANRR